MTENIDYTDFPMATCIGCGCDDDHACASWDTGEPCAWRRLDRSAGLGVCSECPELVEAWDRGDREWRVPMEEANDD